MQVPQFLSLPPDPGTIIQQQLIESNRQVYGLQYDLLTFANPEQLASASAERKDLLQWLAQRASFGYAETKVDCTTLSPGCQCCGAGSWSCLFINGRCNARCFYCPTAQDDSGPPVTNGLAFTDPEEYASYVSSLGFSGVSISGGEPLLAPALTLAYVNAVRRRCGDKVHLWLYTNGILLTTDLCSRLRDAGLNEIRFDLGAVGYSLEKLRLAVGVIPTVTVEIPAVPEDENLLKQKMVELATMGVSHLNLHQMRLTPYNLGNFVERGYILLHGEKITLLESELCALRVVRFGLEQRIPLPVNYCSFPYKRRFQLAASRRRAALTVCAASEVVTEPGYLRVLSSSGVRYCEAALLQNPSYRHPFEKITLDTGRSLYMERRPITPELELSNAERCALEDGGDPPVRLARFERIEGGLAEYF
ncbi:MAG: radical SAM protein [Desulfuromonadaceae bacterium]|nr:radical SAM protein [Desulfuromonadaceae bacterium]MDD5106303.1 radical SAM protein [Desulfuromonadaceae bacterium]